MTEKIYTYSLIRTLYDKGRDYIDSFWPLVLVALSKDGSLVSIESVQGEIEKRFALRIPRYSLSVIITRAKRRGLVDQRQQKFQLSHKGRGSIDALEVERDVERRINEFLDNARQFLEREHGLTLSRDQVRGMVEAFVGEHIDFFEDFAGSAKSSQGVERPEALQIHEAALLDYFRHVEESSPSLFKTLQDVIYGSIISSTIYSQSFAEIGRKFDHTTVFFDTNIVFSILGFHFDDFTKPAEELFDLMKSEGAFEFRVFDFTVDEMVSVLRNYSKHQHMYVPQIKVGSILSSLKSKGWTPADVRQFMANVEDRLWAKGIRIEPTRVDLEKYAVKSADREALAQYKPNQSELGQSHDMAAIAMVRAMRRGSVRRIETARAFFLTSDMKLARYDLAEMGHRDRATVSEVIPDRLLTTMLWLKDPARAGDIPLHAIIAMHSRDLLVARDVWSRFYQTIEELRARGDIDEKDVSVLLYDSQLQELLIQSRPEHIRGEWVLKGIEDAKARLEEARKRELEAQKSAFEQKMGQAEEEREDRLLGMVRDAKEKVKREAERQTAIWFVIAVLAVFVVLVGGSVALWTLIQPLAGLLEFVFSLLVVVLSLVLDPLRVRERLKSRMFNRVYRWKLRSSVLEDLEQQLTGSGADQP